MMGSPHSRSPFLLFHGFGILISIKFKGLFHSNFMNKSSKTGWWIVGIIVVIVLIGWGVSRNSASANTIKIGFIGPLTGDAATYGEPFQKTIELAVSQINAAGGVNGKQIDMIYEDDQCTGVSAASAVQKLANIDGVQAIIGSECSSAVLAAVPVAAQAKVVIFNPGASSPKLTGISLYEARDYPSDAAQGQTTADIAYHKEGYRTIAFIQEQTDYAQGIYDAFSKAFTGYGGTVINESFPSDATDFRSILTDLKAKRPDALFIDTQASPATNRIMEQLAQLGWNPPLILNDTTMGDPETLKTYASQFQGAIGAEFIPDASDTDYQAFVQAYQQQYGEAPMYQNYMVCAYDMMHLLVQGITAVGYNGTALANWIRTVHDWKGASGVLSIGQDGDRIGGFTAEIIKNGVKSKLQ